MRGENLVGDGEIKEYSVASNAACHQVRIRVSMTCSYIGTHLGHDQAPNKREGSWKRKRRCGYGMVLIRPDELDVYSLRLTANVEENIGVSRVDPPTTKYFFIVAVVVTCLRPIEDSCGVVSSSQGFAKMVYGRN